MLALSLGSSVDRFLILSDIICIISLFSEDAPCLLYSSPGRGSDEPGKLMFVSHDPERREGRSRECRAENQRESFFVKSIPGL